MLPIVDGIGSSIQGLILQSSDVSKWAVGSLMPGSFPPIAFIHLQRPNAYVSDIMQDQWALSELKATTANFLADENKFTVEFCKHGLQRVGELCEDLVGDLTLSKPRLLMSTRSIFKIRKAIGVLGRRLQARLEIR